MVSAGFFVWHTGNPSSLGIILHDFSKINASLAVFLGAKNVMGNIPKPLWADVEYSQELKEFYILRLKIIKTFCKSDKL